jgi:hypothetical protein
VKPNTWGYREIPQPQYKKHRDQIRDRKPELSDATVSMDTIRQIGTSPTQMRMYCALCGLGARDGWTKIPYTALGSEAQIYDTSGIADALSALVKAGVIERRRPPGIFGVNEYRVLR